MTDTSKDDVARDCEHASERKDGHGHATCLTCMNVRDMDESAPSTMPTGDRCPIGPLNAHTYNYERNECLWCGPNELAWKPGRWVDLGDGTSAWSVELSTTPGARCMDCGHVGPSHEGDCDRCGGPAQPSIPPAPSTPEEG